MFLQLDLFETDPSLGKWQELSDEARATLITLYARAAAKALEAQMERREYEQQTED